MNYFISYLIAGFLALAEPSIFYDSTHKSLVYKSDKNEVKLSLKIPPNMKFENTPKYFSDDSLGYIVADLAGSDVATALLIAVDKLGKTIWSIDLEAFNASSPLIEKKYIYISGIGKVFKINKTDGKIIWTHSGLYDNHNYRFNGSENIQIKNGVVYFSEKVRVNNNSGELLGANK